MAWPVLTEHLPEIRLLLTGGFTGAFPGGLALNIVVASCAFACSFALAHPLAIARCSPNRTIRMAATAYIELVRSIPLLMVLFWFYFGLPILFANPPNPLMSAVLALTFYATAYQAEYIRSGMQSTGHGQIDAARSLGFSRMQTLFLVTLPQAHKKMLPCYASYFISLFKDTSALYILGLVDLMQAGLITVERAPNRMLEVYLTVGALFFAVCFLASLAARKLEQHVSIRRKPAPGNVIRLARSLHPFARRHNTIK